MRYRLTPNSAIGTASHRPANVIPGRGQRPARPSAFTLVELLVALAVGGILLAVAVPNLQTFIRNSRIDNATDSFLTEIQRARSEAITRGEAILLCRTADPGTNNCRTSADEDWTPGWLMYAVPDFAVSGEVDYNATKHTLIRRGTAAPEGVTIKSDSHGNQWLAIGSDGRLREDDAVAYGICDDRGENAGKLITIPMIGRPYVTDDPSNCDPS